MNLCRFCEGPEHSGGCDREALKAVIGKLREGLRMKTLELQATQKINEKGVIMITSLISHRNQKPRIDIQIGELHTQMDTDAAVKIARDILECAAGSHADAFIFNFLKEKLGQSDQIGAQIIQEFRAYRDQLAQEFKAMQESGAEDHAAAMKMIEGHFKQTGESYFDERRTDFSIKSQTGESEDKSK